MQNHTKFKRAKTARKTMKKIEVVVPPAMKDKVVSAIKAVGVGGVTIWHTQGQGAAEPPLVGQYFSKEAIVTVVPDSKVDAVLDSIANVACTGTKGDGKVFVTNVEDALDICTKEKGESAI
jgi:nitrogen regulatory protein P-II 1